MGRPVTSAHQKRSGPTQPTRSMWLTLTSVVWYSPHFELSIETRPSLCPSMTPVSSRQYESCGETHLCHG